MKWREACGILYFISQSENVIFISSQCLTFHVWRIDLAESLCAWNIKSCEHLLNHVSDSEGYNTSYFLPVKANCIAETKKNRQALQLFFGFVLLWSQENNFKFTHWEIILWEFMHNSIHNVCVKLGRWVWLQNPRFKSCKEEHEKCPNRLLYYLGEGTVFDPFDHLTASSV